jgi:hypothetical protein
MYLLVLYFCTLLQYMTENCAVLLLAEQRTLFYLLMAEEYDVLLLAEYYAVLILTEHFPLLLQNEHCAVLLLVA